MKVGWSLSVDESEVVQIREPFKAKIFNSIGEFSGDVKLMATRLVKALYDALKED